MLTTNSKQKQISNIEDESSKSHPKSPSTVTVN